MLEKNNVFYELNHFISFENFLPVLGMIFLRFMTTVRK